MIATTGRLVSLSGGRTAAGPAIRLWWAGAIGAPALGLVGCQVNASCVAGPGRPSVGVLDPQAASSTPATKPMKALALRLRLASRSSQLRLTRWGSWRPKRDVRKRHTAPNAAMAG